MLPMKIILWTRRVQFWQTNQKFFTWSSKKNWHKSDWKTWKPMKFRLMCWKRFAQKTEKFPPKMRNTIGKVFFSKKMLPMKLILWTRRVQFWQTNQNIFAWSSKKNWHKSDWKTWKPIKLRLPCWKTFAQKPEKFPPKMWNTNGKVFFSKKMLPMKTILWTHRVQFRQTSL